MDPFDMVMDEKQVAKLLSVSPKTLRNWRYLGRGPAFIKLGRTVRYKISDLDKYIKKITNGSWSLMATPPRDDET